MPILSKQILAPRPYCINLGNGRIRVMDVSPSDIRHYCMVGREMLRQGLPLSVPEEHQLWANPENPARVKAASLVESNKGFITDFSIKEDGTLWCDLDIPNAEYAERVKTEIRFVSPQFRPGFVDCDGKRWPHHISHVALTTKPVWHGQKPFELSRSAVELSTGADPLTILELHCIPSEREPFSLSQYDQVVLREGIWQFSYGDDMSEEKEPEESPKPEPKAKDKEESEGQEGPKKTDDKLSEPVWTEEQLGLFSRLKEALEAKANIQLPDITDPKNFVEHLIVALHAMYPDAKTEEVGDDDPNNPNDEERLKMAKEEPGVISMSQFAALQGELTETKKTSSKLLSNAAGRVRSEYQAKISAHERAKRLPKDKADAMRGALEKVTDMSLLSNEDINIARMDERLAILDELARDEERRRLTIQESADFSHGSRPLSPDWHYDNEDNEETKKKKAEEAKKLQEEMVVAGSGR